MLLNMIFSDDSQRSGSALDQPKPYKSPAVKWVRCLCLYCVAYGAFAFCNSARLFFENLTQVLNQPYGSIEANQIHLRHFTQEVVYDSVNVIFYVVLMISLGLLLSAVNFRRPKTVRATPGPVYGFAIEILDKYGGSAMLFSGAGQHGACEHWRIFIKFPYGFCFRRVFYLHSGRLP